MRFKKGELTKESFEVIMHDLQSMEIKQTENSCYHYDLLVGNLKDIWGIE